MTRRYDVLRCWLLVGVIATALVIILQAVLFVAMLYALRAGAP